MLDGDVGDQLAAFFDGVQVAMSATEVPVVSRGYAGAERVSAAGCGYRKQRSN